ncbi:hypothetical protein SAMN05444266_102214 [Chitinophaga jiangningensis]|uniref:Uncharacterized protein n=1 Tax=Chitinophaga jiangningensis TaxID=1419482 RepID=A0A1M6Y9C9_9BACT|nr:hypothetical protein [Chitinophaga jiangningensis]SHL14887.1 hypothetical protein SAMN05444266_102214 [Chitinophaga jiangningensis]
MPLIPKKFSESLKAKMQQTNNQKQDSPSAAINAYCEQLESDVYNAVRSITITIPPGAIIVQTAMGPAANVTPIVLESTVK